METAVKQSDSIEYENSKAYHDETPRTLGSVGEEREVPTTLRPHKEFE